jgi:RNA polymerase sigma-70 factor (ECF subfamily)
MQTKMNVNKQFHQTSLLMEEEMIQIQKAKVNPADFAPLYRKYYDQIFRYIVQRMQDEELAFDVTAQVFMKAMSNLSRYEYRGVPFSSWLYRIAKSELFQSFRDKKSEKTVHFDTNLLGNVSQSDEEDDFEPERRKLFKSLSLLNHKDLIMIEMRFFEKRPFKEIGELMGITENNAKVKTFRALDRLRKLFLVGKS